ncbi:Type II secretory pathway component PulK-like protein [Sphingomonas spermidinifaciens]|uniref:Type II secretion system protein K n=1 Tax=Sphingomonas spermidinifaciens TaxID=1141889 RepID=A0A2A4B2H5_9SPHN|nr:type II secretion system protein GspK [Sphingomonas spermidinifaciens]PCD01884.1 Type II secretory pathway component PulK-like protein [Sphingomonas spermidinifaciens]
MKPIRAGEEGLILVNVLLFVAIASGLVLLMVNREELALDGALRMREASRAAAIVRGGELSALTALRRDAEDAPEVDHRAEPWAAVAQRNIPIEGGGSFDLAVADAEGRFNINNVRSGESSAVILFESIARDAGMTPEQIVQAIGYVRAAGPVTDLRPIRLAGLNPATADRLGRMVTALPVQTQINLNAAGRELMTLLLRDPVAVERLLAVRERKGFLDRDDLSRENLMMPPGLRLASDHFWVRTRASVGSTSQQGAALIERRKRDDGTRETVVVERWRGAAMPPDVPEFPAAR